MGNHDYSSNVSSIALLRTTLDEVFSDHRFFVRKSLSPCQIVHHVLTQILQGERDLDRLKTSTLEKIDGECRASDRLTTRQRRGCAYDGLALDSSGSKIATSRFRYGSE
jgi:hypothetical protein